MRHLISEKWIFLGLFVFIFSLLLIKVWSIGWSLGSDGLGYYAHIRSIMVDHDLDYANEYRNFNPLGHSVPDPDIKTPTGRVPNNYPIGPAFLWIPFFLIAHTITWLSNSLGYFIPRNGYSLPYQVLIGLGPQIYGLIGLAFILRIIRHFYPQNIALIATLTIVLSTNVIYYLTVESTMSHAFSLFTVSLFIYYGIKNYKTKNKRQYFVYGLLGALMTLTRYQNGLFMLFPIFELFDSFFNSRNYTVNLKILIKKGFVYLFGFLLGITPQLIFWKIIYGSYYIKAYGTKSFYGGSTHFIDILFSSNHGLFAWTPIILFSIIGLFFFAYNQRKWGVFFLVLLLGQYFVNSTWHGWTFGASYSIRSFINCTFIFSIGLAALIHRLQNYTKIITFSILFFILWNFLLIIQYSLGYIPPSGNYEISTIINAQFYLLRNALEYIIQKLFITG